MSSQGTVYHSLPPEADETGNVLLDTLSDHNFFISSTKFPRRIIAEDPTYNRPEIPQLKTLCLNKIAFIYNGSQNLKKLSAYEKHYLAKRLPLNFPIIAAIRFVSDDIYWQKRCLNQWEICDLTYYSCSWKVMCLQRTIEQLIEEYDPSDPNGNEYLKQLKSIIVAANKFIKRLEIKRLKAIKIIEEVEEIKNEFPTNNTSETEKKVVTEEYRINFETILANLPHLEEFSVTYNASKCGQDFDWYMSRFTYDEVKSLTAAIMPCYNLRMFCLHKSELDCIKLNLLIQGLLHLPALESLQLQNNLIGDKGAFCLAKLITVSTKLTHLNLSHNRIGVVGGEAISFALTKNSTLKHLNLRLNTLQEKGCNSICRALAINKGLETLNLASNEMGEKTAEIIGQALKFNQTLVEVDFSCNLDIGVVGGVHILEGLEKNNVITEMDLRWCNCGQDTEFYVDQLLRNNRNKTN